MGEVSDHQSIVIHFLSFYPVVGRVLCWKCVAVTVRRRRRGGDETPPVKKEITNHLPFGCCWPASCRLDLSFTAQYLSFLYRPLSCNVKYPPKKKTNNTHIRNENFRLSVYILQQDFIHTHTEKKKRIFFLFFFLRGGGDLTAFVQRHDVGFPALHKMQKR